MITSFTEENYLKTIHRLADEGAVNVSTNAIAEALQTKASSVTDMIKKLCDKKLLDHVPYQGVRLTEAGSRKALDIIRKHRLWEVFLVERLGLGWDEVHDIAEQLEHTVSERLYDQLDKYLNYPRFDPHGDPIPDAQGILTEETLSSLSEIPVEDAVWVSRVTVHLPDFLQYLQDIGLVPGRQVKVLRKFEFDGSLSVQIIGGKESMLSRQVASHIFVKY
jgi:DtxR family Mn-dependent transcriptional regulator